MADHSAPPTCDAYDMITNVGALAKPVVHPAALPRSKLWVRIARAFGFVCIPILRSKP